MSPDHLTWLIVAVSTAAVIARPLGWPEMVWAVAGAIALVALQLLSPQDALVGVAKGLDVYLFLTGMMLMSEVAREEGLFDWLAALATRHAAGSGRRLFLLIYGVGTLVTTFLSNDATAVVLTPAVAAAMRSANVKEPLPYLLVCALIANAASFVLPISNPANLVIYGSKMPPLLEWLRLYGPPSAVSILLTFLTLRWSQRRSLAQAVGRDIEMPVLTRGGMLSAAGIVATALVLMVCSALDSQLGLPTAIAGVCTTLVVLAMGRRSPWKTLSGVSWGVLPLVAGLFVFVEALDRTGVIGLVSRLIKQHADSAVTSTAWASGVIVAVASNLINNLPAGLIAGSAVQGAAAPGPVMRAVLIGVDLGPNLSVTGSLATILWLTALRREGYDIGAWKFLKLGMIVMTPTLLATLAAARL